MAKATSVDVTSNGGVRGSSDEGPLYLRKNRGTKVIGGKDR